MCLRSLLSYPVLYDINLDVRLGLFEQVGSRGQSAVERMAGVRGEGREDWAGVR